MKIVTREEIADDAEEFRILTGSHRSQIASMNLKAGGSSGEYGNEHAHADQILYVVEGEAEVIVEGRTERLSAGDAVLIEAGEPHQINAVGKNPLRTFNVYAPPGY